MFLGQLNEYTNKNMYKRPFGINFKGSSRQYK